MDTCKRRADARKESGFSLIELMVALAIIAILTAIAIPSYNAYVIRGQRAAAKGALVQTAQNMERWYTANGSYGNATGAFPLTPLGSSSCVAVAPTDGGSTTYCVTGTAAVSSGVAVGFTLTATPCGDGSPACPAGANLSYTDPTCDALTLDNTGQKGISIGGATQVVGGATGTTLAAQCWQQ